VTDLITPRRIAGTFEAQRALRSHHITSLGVRPEVLLQPLPLRVGSIAWIDAETFAFEQHLVVDLPVEQAILILVTDPHGDALDIAAWHPASGRLGTWCHRAWALGQDGIYAPRLTRHGALPVWRNPLRWLEAGQKGVVLIQPQLAAAFLCDAGPLLAEDVEHGRELKEQLVRPAPRILIPSASLSARVA
jgi:hypothetical protein